MAVEKSPYRFGPFAGLRAEPPPPKGGGKEPTASSALRFARHLRQNMSEEEVILWSELRLLRKAGLHFRRQMPRDGYVLDFVCLKARVIVEVDGEQHSFGTRPQKDAVRDSHFRREGFATLRYAARQIRRELYFVLEDIIAKSPSRLGLGT